MSQSKILAVVLVFVALSAGAALAADTPAQKAKDGPAQELAIFSVPNLMEGTTLKSLAQALGKRPGIVSAQVDAEKGTFNVTFEPGKTGPDEILKVISSISKDAKLLAVAPADGKAALGSDCGKCPSARSCSKAKK